MRPRYNNFFILLFDPDDVYANRQIISSMRRRLCKKPQRSGETSILKCIVYYKAFQFCQQAISLQWLVRRWQLAAFNWIFIQYENKDRGIKSKTIQGSLEERIISQRRDKRNNSILSNSRERVRLQRKERKSENLRLPLKAIIRPVWLEKCLA